MLANGTKLYYSEDAKSYKLLDELKEVPEVGVEPEKIENTPLNAKTKRYEIGVGDPGDGEYTFVYAQTAGIIKLIELSDAGKPVHWAHVFPDGSGYKFDGTPSYRLTGGKLNDVVDMKLKIAYSSDLVYEAKVKMTSTDH